jgi:hypothetical protein
VVGAFDLKGCGRRAEHEVGREGARRSGSISQWGLDFVSVAAGV